MESSFNYKTKVKLFSCPIPNILKKHSPLGRGFLILPKNMLVNEQEKRFRFSIARTQSSFRVPMLGFVNLLSKLGRVLRFFFCKGTKNVPSKLNNDSLSWTSCLT